MGQQEGTQLSATLLRSLMEWSEAPAVRGIHRCLEPDEQRSDVQVAIWRGIVQGYESSLRQTPTHELENETLWKWANRHIMLKANKSPPKDENIDTGQ